MLYRSIYWRNAAPAPTTPSSPSTQPISTANSFQILSDADDDDNSDDDEMPIGTQPPVIPVGTTARKSKNSIVHHELAHGVFIRSQRG